MNTKWNHTGTAHEHGILGTTPSLAAAPNAYILASMSKAIFELNFVKQIGSGVTEIIWVFVSKKHYSAYYVRTVRLGFGSLRFWLHLCSGKLLFLCSRLGWSPSSPLCTRHQNICQRNDGRISLVFSSNCKPFSWHFCTPFCVRD